MKKIKVLEVNNIDLPGKVFNGYNFIDDLNKNKFQIKQAVIIKQSNNNHVVKILDNDKLIQLYEKYQIIEEKLSIHNLLSVTTPALMNMEEYKEADIIHFHMFHNTKLSIPSLIKIANEKKVIISLHDPWFLTGRCVHFYKCDKWKNGCKNCQYLNTLFPFKEDNCSEMWNLKKYTLNNSNIDFFVPSNWLYNLAIESEFIKNKDSIHFIPFGINLDKYKKYNNKKELRKKYKIDEKDIVIFLRAQLEFKGTEYVLEALKLLNVDRKVTVITCDNVGLLNDVKDKCNIIDLGIIQEDKLIEIMNISDIFLMPSKAETFGMMAIEAMACELPVISFDNTALPHTIHAPSCGISVPDKDIVKLMEAIKELILNEKDIIRRGKLGREICLKEYSYQKYLDSLSKEYEKVYKAKKAINTIDEEPFNMEDYEKYIFTIKKLIKKRNITLKDKKFIFNNPISYLNLANEEIYNEILKSKIKIPLKRRIRLYLKKSKIIRKIYYSLKK